MSGEHFGDWYGTFTLQHTQARAFLQCVDHTGAHLLTTVQTAHHTSLQCLFHIHKRE